MSSSRKSFTSKKRRPQSKSQNHSLRRYRERFSRLRLEPLEDRRLLSTIMSAQMNSNPGWTISGQWAFGQPQGLTQNPGSSYPDPTSGYTGVNVYGVNLYGDYNATVGGPYFLKTSAIDCSNYTNINLSFRRWLNTDAYDWVSATVDVSNNGTTWNRVWNNTDGIVENAWQLMQYNISAYANNKSTVYIRWGYQVFLYDAYQCSGWNIDDVLVTGDPASNPPGVTVNPTTGLTTTEAGGTANFTMVLNSQPTADVTIGLSSSDATEGTVSPSSVTFTTSNWSTPRTVTVTGVNDTLVDGNIAYSIVTAAAASADANYNGLNASDVSVTNQDNDTAALTLSIAAPSVSEAGGAAATTGTVTRNFDLSNPLVVTLTSSDTSEATVPSTVTILANQTSATFNIAAVNDALIDGVQTVTITASAPYSSGPFASDTSFGTSGVVTTTLRNNVSPQYTDLEIQTDGKILAIGRNATADDTWDLIRVLANGSYDAAFGTAGKVSTTFSGETMVRPAGIIRHEDGKITIVGNTLTAWLLARYNSDGSPDTTFSGDGQTLLEPISSSRIYDGVPNPDGSIFVVGERYDGQGMILGRVLTNGTLDTSFGTGGIVSPTLDPASTEYAYAMLQQPDGKLVIAGRSDYSGINDKYFVARFNTNGALDTTFSGDGFQSIDLGYLTQEANSLALQADGRIVLAGYVSTGSPNYASDWGVVRVDANGNLDASFSGDGIDIVTFNGGTQDDTARDVVIQSDGKIVVVGSAFVSGNGSDRAFVRYNSDGSRDTSFGSSGIQILPNLAEVWEEEWAAAIQADGKLVTYSGFVSNYRIERYILPGSLVATATLNVTDDDETLPPTVTGQVPAANSTINASSVNIDVTFSKPVVGVDATDLVLSGAAAAAAVKGTPTNVSGNTWRFPVSGLSNGALTISLAPDANDIEDSSGNDLANIAWSYTVALLPSNPTSITIPSSGSATPYPSTITIADLPGMITDVNVTLTGLTHTYPGDIDILLVGPGGQKVLILSDVGGDLDISGVNLTLDDAASAYVLTSLITSGTFKPTNIDSTTDSFSSPAPASPYASTLAAFNGTTPNGVWSLYVVDDASGDLGSISGGWSLSILTTGGTAVIGDTVFSDLNSNGVQDPGETGVANWEIYLDSNTNGQWDSGEPKTTTNASGNYSFNNLAAGTYRVAEVQRGGWTQTSPASPGYYTVTLADGQTRSDVDFGNHQLPHQDFSIIASVDGTVQDKEPDTIFETLYTTSTTVLVGSYPSGYSSGDQRSVFEFNISSLVSVDTIVAASLRFKVGMRSYSSGSTLNCSVYGYAGDGVVSLEDATAPSTLIGTFQANTLGVFDVPLDAAVIQTLRSSGSYLGIMIRMPSVDYSWFSIDSLEHGSPTQNPTLILSALIVPPAEIRSSVWNDLDADGVQDAGEPGVAGAGVEVYSSTDTTIGNSDDAFVAQTVTDSAGNYVLGNLASTKNYYLVFRTPAGFTFTSKDIGSDDAKDSDANSVGISDIFTLSPGQTDSNRDVGLVGSLPEFGFVLPMGATLSEYSNSMATDAQGNIYITGRFQLTVDFDPGPGTSNLTCEAYSDVFVAKYSAAGALIWARRMGGDSLDESTAIAVASDGSVYTVGAFSSTNADFDPGSGTYTLTSAGSWDIFISKLDSAGNFGGAYSIGNSDEDVATGIKIADDGGIYIAGYFSGIADLDPTSGNAIFVTMGNSDVFLLKLNSAGGFSWVRRMGGSGYDYSSDIAVALDGTVFLSGTFQNSVDFNPGSSTFNLSSNGDQDIFVSKFDSLGNWATTFSIGGFYADSVSDIAVSADGSLYLTGSFRGTVDFCPGSATDNLSNSNYNAFIMKMNAAGTYQWARQLGKNSYTESFGMAVSSDGSVYTVGTFGDWADFDPGPDYFSLTGKSSFDTYISKLDSNGNFVWARQIGGVEGASTRSIFEANDGSIYVSGGFDGTVDFDPASSSFNLTSTGYKDIFIAKYIPLHAPSALTLSANSIAENQAVSSVIGNFSSQDLDPGEAFTYTLVVGTGSDDNALFSIDSSGQLKTAAILDFETKPAYSIRVRTTDYSGMRYEKVFTITATDVSEAFVVGAANWTAVGLTVKLGADGKLHAYRTGTTIDAVPPHVLANVTGIQITGRSNADDELTVDFGSGVPLPAAGLNFNGGTHAGGDALLLRGTAGNDAVTLSSAQIVLAGSPVINFSGIEFFGFDLISGEDTLLVDHTTLKINRTNAFSASTNVTVDGGTLDFGGYSSPLGNLVLKDNGQAIMTAVQNASTTVTSGTLTATSIVCDTLTIGSPVLPTTRTWDGGGADDKWSTAANWAGDVAPLPGDLLVFPAGVAKLQSVNDYPVGTVFGSIDVSGENYLFQNGIVSSSTVHVSSGTLTTSSIFCDTLLIGSTSETAAAPARSLATDSVTLTTAVLHSVASNLATTTNVGEVTLAPQAIGGPIQVDPLRLDIAEVVSIPANQAASVPYSVGTLSALSSVRPIVQHVIPTREIASTVISMTTKDQPTNKTEVALPLSGLFADAFIADLNSTARTISFNPFQLTERLKDTVYEESTDSLAGTTKQLPIALSESQSVRSLALQSLMQDSQYHFGSNQINSKLVGNKRSCKPDKLVNEAVDEFHADLAGAID